MSSSLGLLAAASSQAAQVAFECLFDVGDNVALSRKDPCACPNCHAQQGGGAQPGHDVAGEEALQEGRGQQTASLQKRGGKRVGHWKETLDFSHPG